MKSCKDCIYQGTDEITNAMVCEYPVPICIKWKAGGGFISGVEAEHCVLFKTVEMVKQEKEAARRLDQPIGGRK